MFQPPRCPRVECEAHSAPRPGFYRRRGYYRPKCRPHPVPRFRCKLCDRGFSRQTFRADYRDNRPDLNAKLFSLLTSGLGLRQSARLLALSRRCAEMKFRKIARHVERLHPNLIGEFPSNTVFMLDEMETFEGWRTARPLTLPILIERESMFIVDARCAPIRPSGRMTPKREAAIRRCERRYGPRTNRSVRALRRVLEAAAHHCGSLPRVALTTDEKMIYPKIAREVFGKGRVVHKRVSSRQRRDTSNPLFRINLTNAMARDLCGRLRRRSWLVSKKARHLDDQMMLYACYRNYVRPRFNRDRATPAQIIGFVKDKLSVQQLLSWRQDWGLASPYPAADGSVSVRDAPRPDLQML